MSAKCQGPCQPEHKQEQEGIGENQRFCVLALMCVVGKSGSRHIGLVAGCDGTHL